MSYPKIFLIAFFAYLSILDTSLRAEEITSEHEPLYAGTLLAFYAQNAEPGRLSVEPYLFAFRRYGFYTENWGSPHKKHSTQLDLLVSLETGITKNIDITLDVNGAYSHFNKQHSWLYGDTTAFLGFQILHDQKQTATPDFRILIGETLPTGKYEHLNPDKNGSDILGSGTYATSLTIVLAKTCHFSPKHPVNFNLNLYYVVSSLAKVHGFNCYGGAFDTRGKVKPGDQFITNVAIQYSIDRNWVIGTDIHYFHQNRSSFSGKKGTLPDHTSPYVGLPSSEQFSLAPCVEYSWSEDFSCTLGPWFTVAGRNSLQFMSAAATVFYYF